MLKIAITGLRVPPYTPHDNDPAALFEAVRQIAGEWAKEPLELHTIFATLQFPNGREMLAEVRYQDGRLSVTVPAQVEALVTKSDTK